MLRSPWKILRNKGDIRNEQILQTSTRPFWLSQIDPMGARSLADEVTKSKCSDSILHIRVEGRVLPAQMTQKNPFKSYEYHPGHISIQLDRQSAQERFRGFIGPKNE